MVSGGNKQAGQRQDDPLVEAFNSPGSEFRPVPLWWWDGEDLNKERMTEQLEALVEGGVSSICFIQKYPHGPAGDEVQYFDEEWWDRMEHAAEECDRLGMELWVHDETYHHSPPSWREYWQHRIRTETTEHGELQGYVLDRIGENVTGPGTVSLTFPSTFDVLTAAAYPRAEDGALRVDAAVELDPEGGELRWETDDGDWHVAVIGTRPEGLCYTKPDAVERYIDIHFEEYRRRLGDLVGDVLVGTFEDELVVLDEEVPCDERVLERFEAEYGYDPVPQLIGLYEDLESDADRLRTDYYDVVTSLLEENWFEPLYEWHEEHDLVRSHDNWGRNDLANGTVQYGDYYRTMRWYQVPGYDDGGQEAIGSRNFFDAKLAASIAACYDRDRVWGELFHSTGWGFTPEAQLAGVVENYCYGANLYDKHGCYYTTQGGWWEHAPPDVHFRQPYWEDVEGLNEAATRLSQLFSQGHPVVDIAMLYPSTSLHAGWRPDEGIDEAREGVDRPTREIAERIYDDGCDLVLTDPDSLSDADVEGGKLGVQDMEIPVLLLGPTTAVRQETLETIRAFYNANGVVLAAGGLPTTLVGDPADTEDRGDGFLAETLEYVFGEAYRRGQAGDVEGYHVSGRKSDDVGVGVLADLDTDLVGLVDEFVDRDVQRSEPDVYHTHRHIDDRDAYLLFNVRDEKRSVDVRLRGEGTPERWDPFTGEVEPVRSYDRDDGYVDLELSFAPHGFHVIVLNGETRDDPRVVRTSLSTVESVEGTDGGIRVTGRARSSGSQTARVVDGDDRREGSVENVDVPDPIEIGEWTFDLLPTMDNEWGDFRYPPDDRVIGPEVREISHRAEKPGVDGLQRGWNRSDVDVEAWEPVERTYGPYFWRQTGVDDDPRESPREAPSDWEAYEFSKQLGKPDTHPYMLGYTTVLSDEYLVSPDGEGSTYFWTTLRSPESRTAAVHYGAGIEEIRLGSHRIDTDRPEDIGGLASGAGPDEGGTAIVGLPAGRTEIQLRIGPGVETFFAIESPDGGVLDRDMRYVPRLRWFLGEDVTLDYKPWVEAPVGWYRFEVPAGTRSFDLPLRGDPTVWVEGEKRPVEDDAVTFAERIDEPATVAVRVEQERGAYGGAAFERSPRIDTAPVAVEATDWADLGLEAYSGRARYRTTVSLPELESGDRAVLDLGDVAVAATVAVDGTEVGSTFRRPFTVDITDAVTPGKNEIEIEVANTLANHFDTETPKRYARIALDYFADTEEILPTVDREDFVSGLLGPVTIRIEPEVRIEA